jgi:hypothetical protein
MIITGCDFHSRSQQIAMLETETGEILERRLEHESGEAWRFQEGLKEGALVGVESMGYTRWFAEMLGELRTRAQNGLQAIALRYGLRRRGAGTSPAFCYLPFIDLSESAGWVPATLPNRLQCRLQCCPRIRHPNHHRTEWRL